MNIFDSLKKYGAWRVKESRKPTEEEISCVRNCVVVDSEFGNSLRIELNNGYRTFIPLSTNSTKGIGEVVDFASCTLLTLSKEGESDIRRVEC